jgi:hypothetical protein
MSTPAEKQHAHELIERLPGDQISTIVRFMEFMLLDPLTRSLANAPVDSQPISDEEAAALDQAHAAIGRGEGISHEDILQEFGLARKP